MKFDAPARHCEPTDEQLQRLMHAAVVEARVRAAVADRNLKAAVNAEVQKVRQRYLSRPLAGLATSR